MRPQHRLRPPRVGVAGNDRLRITPGHRQQGGHQFDQQTGRAVDLLAQPEPDIQRDLIVAAAAGVDLFSDGTRAFFELADHQRVDVLVVGAVVEIRPSGVVPDRFENSHQLFTLGGSQDADAFERPRMGLRSADVCIQKAPVEME